MIETLVRWSSFRDTDGLPMILIGGASYPQSLAADIAHQILKMLEAAPSEGKPPCGSTSSK